MDGGGEGVLPDGKAKFRGEKAEFGELGGCSWRFWTKHGDEVVMGGEFNGGGRGWLNANGGEMGMPVLDEDVTISKMLIVLDLLVLTTGQAFPWTGMSRAPARSKNDLIGHILNNTSPVWDHLLCLIDICTWPIFNLPDDVFSRSDHSVEHRASHPLSRTPANGIRTVNNRRASDPKTIFLKLYLGAY